MTVILVLDCLFLTLLILVQLPKKEAGLGQAFGGAATDALFGAGSGNALTKMTKYAAGVFFALTISLSILNAQQVKSNKSSLERTLQGSRETQPAVPATTPSAPAAATAEKPTATPATPGGLLSTTTAATNTGAKPAANPPAAPAPGSTATSAPPAAEKSK